MKLLADNLQALARLYESEPVFPIDNHATPIPGEQAASWTFLDGGLATAAADAKGLSWGVHFKCKRFQLQEEFLK